MIIMINTQRDDILNIVSSIGLLLAFTISICWVLAQAGYTFKYYELVVPFCMSVVLIRTLNTIAIIGK